MKRYEEKKLGVIRENTGKLLLRMFCSDFRGILLFSISIVCYMMTHGKKIHKHTQQMISSPTAHYYIAFSQAIMVSTD